MNPHVFSSFRRLTGMLLALLLVSLGATAASAQTWQFYGPQNSPNGTNTAGRTLAVLVNPDNEAMVFAGHSSGGLWKSTNTGGSWSPVWDGPVGAIAFRRHTTAPGDVDRIILGSGEWTGYDVHASGSGLYYSNDYGATWLKPISWGEAENKNVCSISVDAASDVIYIGTTGGLYIATAGGLSWSPALARFGASEITDVLAHPTTPGTALCTVMSPDPAVPGLTKGVFRTTNFGVTWTLVVGPSSGSPWPSSSNWGRALVAWSVSQPNLVYLRILNETDLFDPAACPGNSLDPDPNSRKEQVAIIARSTDAGQSWPTGNIVWNQTTKQTDPLYCLVEARGRSCFGVDRNNSQLLFCGGATLYSSTNGGANWTLASGQPDWHYVESVSNGNWLASDRGVYFLPTGGVLTDKNSNYRTIQFYHIAVDPGSSNGDPVYGGTQDQGNWTDTGSGGTAWTRFSGGDGQWTAASNQCLNCGSLSGSTVVYWWWGLTQLVSSCSGGPNGATVLASTGWGPIVPDRFASPPIVPNSVYVFQGSSLYRIMDGCSNPAPLLTLGTQRGDKVATADMARNRAGNLRRMYVMTYDARVFRLNETSGGSWTSTQLGLPPWGASLGSGTVKVLTGASQSQDAVYVTLRPWLNWSAAWNVTQGNVWVYSAATQTWTALSNGLPHEPVYSLEIDPANSQRIFVGTQHHVYYTTNGGASWAAAPANGLPSVMVTDLVMHAGTRYLYAGTYGRGIYRSLIDTWFPQSLGASPSIGPVEISGSLQARESLLVYTTSVEGRVTIQMFDIQGRAVRTLLDREVSAGMHEFEPNANGLKSGVYFARMQVNARPVDAIKFVVR